jgi:hypothetical protein
MFTEKTLVTIKKKLYDLYSPDDTLKIHIQWLLGNTNIQYGMKLQFLKFGKQLIIMIPEIYIT